MSPRILRMDFSTRKPGSSPGHPQATGILLRSGAAECVLDRHVSGAVSGGLHRMRPHYGRCGIRE
jgi:hypothetical protein